MPDFRRWFMEVGLAAIRTGPVPYVNRGPESQFRNISLGNCKLSPLEK
jgi:hypothetical protein